MLVCGIHDGHNAAVALVREGRLLGALQEERLTRIKNCSGFPTRALKALLSSVGAAYQDVDAFVFAGHEVYLTPGGSVSDREAQIRAYKANCGLSAALKRRLRQTPARTVAQRLRSRHRFEHLSDCGVEQNRIFTVEHHRCHSTTAFYGRGASSDVLVMTLDGAGDSLCATVSVTDNQGKLRRVAAIDERHSIGSLWAMLTALMGMVPLEHEYKMMGMAPYSTGAPARAVAERFARTLEMNGGSWHLAKGAPDPLYGYEYWRRSLEFVRFDHVCGGLQLFTEKLVASWVRYWLRKTGSRKLRLSGGVFMNVKLNKALGELEEVEDLYVFPSCGDETNAIGAAWAHSEDQGKAAEIEALGPLYLGPEPQAADRERAAGIARENGLRVERPQCMEDEIARLLAEGRVVARYNGREEFGARALGNRSILADPSRWDVVREINRAIKCRDFWMPFAPSILEGSEGRYLRNPKCFAAPYMILTFDSQHSDEIVAACHPEDKTVRPQIVQREWNPSYYGVLESFFKRTGRPAILNTSLNLHGEPIVSSPADAVSLLERSGLQFLALGPYIISKDSA